VWELDGLLAGAAVALMMLVGAAFAGLLVSAATVQFGLPGGERTQAEQRATVLLKEWLSPRQLFQYRKAQYFDVEGSHTGKLYRIHHGRQANICELDSRGRPAVTWCFGPEGHLPTGDILLTQKIALETNEQVALQVANRTRTYR
jgi:hypothetical protein